MTTEPLKALFLKSPTRELQEVQKVGMLQDVQNDVEEFYQTESAKHVLEAMADIIGTAPKSEPRFLYVHATFGSGKTHLLKLISLATGQVAGLGHISRELVDRFGGFKKLVNAMSKGPQLLPVFLNLLNRDVSRGSNTSLALMIYKALGKQLGYSTDPLWLLDWCWQLEANHSCLDNLHEITYQNKTFEQVQKNKAELRSWLYSVVPGMTDTPYETKDAVKESIAQAIERVEGFDHSDLASRFNVPISRRGQQAKDASYEVLVGLDELALFVGDSRQRYREAVAVIEALLFDVGCPIVATGQWSLEKLHEDFMGEPQDEAWYTAEVELKGADTELVVQRRWLRKNAAGQATISKLVDEFPTWDLNWGSQPEAGDVVDSYPFRSYDLRLLREVMQGLITQGVKVQHEYVQGRALLVLVRSLFTKFGWAEREVGAIVPWDAIFDLLKEETALIPSEINEILARTTIEFPKDDMPVRVAKVLFLLDQVEGVLTTGNNVAGLLINNIDDDIDQLQVDVATAIERLKEKHYIRAENRDGEEVYRVLSKTAFDLAQRSYQRAAQVKSYQLGARITDYLADNEFLGTEGKHALDLNTERAVPVEIRYSVLGQLPHNPPHTFDAVVVRVLANRADTLAEEVELWKERNAAEEGCEHVLVALSLPGVLEDRLRQVIALEEIINLDPKARTELISEQREQLLKLEKDIGRNLTQAAVHIPQVDESVGQFSSDIESVYESTVRKLFPQRKVLSKPLQHTDDAQQIFRMFAEQNAKMWPLSAKDAELVGLDLETLQMDTGWAAEFMARFHSDYLHGEEVLQYIEERGGRYLGTPYESVSALLLTLAGFSLIEIRENDHPVSEPYALGKLVRSKQRVRNCQIWAHSDGGQGAVTIKDVIAGLTGEEAPSGPSEDLVEELDAWLDTNRRNLIELLDKIEMHFPKESFSALKSYIQKPQKTIQEVVLRQSGVYAEARQLFGVPADDDLSLWGQFSKQLEWFMTHEPMNQIARELDRIENAGEVPSVSEVSGILSKAREYRRDKARTVYNLLTDEVTSQSEPNRICSDLTVWITKNEQELRKSLKQIDEEFSEDLADLDQLLEDTVSGRVLDEADLVAVSNDVERLAELEALLAGGSEASLWGQLKETAKQLEAQHPSSSVRNQIDRLVNGSGLTTASPELVKRLLDQAESPEEEDTETPEFARRARMLQEKLNELPEGSIVVVLDGRVTGE